MTTTATTATKMKTKTRKRKEKTWKMIWCKWEFTVCWRLKRKTKAVTDEFVLEITAATVFQFLFRQYHVHAADFHKDNPIFLTLIPPSRYQSVCVLARTHPLQLCFRHKCVTKKFFVCQICISFLLSYKSLHNVCCITWNFLFFFYFPTFLANQRCLRTHTHALEQRRNESFSPNANA